MLGQKAACANALGIKPEISNILNELSRTAPESCAQAPAKFYKQRHGDCAFTQAAESKDARKRTRMVVSTSGV
jgi:hypothetical protein